MPLLPGKENIGKNITELKHSDKNRSKKQILAIAIALAKAGLKKEKK